jgi:hypothetical protein
LGDMSYLGGMGVAESHVAASTLLTAIASDVANVKGSLVSLGQASRSGYLWLFLANYGVSMQQMVDFTLSNTPGSRIVLADLQFTGSASYFTQRYVLPLHVRAGETIYARTQSVEDTKTIYAGFMVVPPVFNTAPPLSKSFTLGKNVTSTQGTEVQVAGSVNTKGAWVSFGALPARCKILAFNVGTLANPYTARAVGTRWFMDIGIGSTGNEKILIPDYPLTMSSGLIFGPGLVQFPLSLPAGTELCVRIQGTAILATSHLYVVFYGFY